jgi:hypothetical protein
LHRFHFPQRYLAAVWMLCLDFRCARNSAERGSALGGYDALPESGWTTLPEAEQGPVAFAIRRTEKQHDWRLPGDPSEDPRLRVEAHFAAARARRVMNGAH